MFNNKYVRKLNVTGGGKSYFLTLPKEIVQNLSWKKGEKKVVFAEGNRIIIEDWTPENPTDGNTNHETLNPKETQNQKI